MLSPGIKIFTCLPDLKPRILILFIFFLLETLHCYSQVQQEWVRLYPDSESFNAVAKALALDDSGNVYITGSAGAYSFSAFCTIKYTSSGSHQWAVFYYGSNYGGRLAKAIALDGFSNVYVTGYSNNPASYFDYCTVKYNSSGVQQWVRYYNGPVNGDDEAEKLDVDNAGNIYVSGFSQTGGSFAYTTVKYSSDGRELWVRTFPQNSLVHVADIEVDNNCNVYITGDYAVKSVTVKYDSSGNQLWEQQYYGYGALTGARSLALDGENNVYIAGYGNGIISQSDFFTIKYSYNGVQQWVKRFNTDSAEYSKYAANSIVLDSSGNIYVSGFFSPTQGASRKLCIVKYSNSGDLLWVEKDTARLSTEQSYMDIDKNNNLYVTSANYLPPPYYNGMMTIEYDSSGKMRWRTIYQIVSIATPSCMKVDDVLNIYLAGQSNGKMCTIKYSQLVGVNNTNNEIPNKFILHQNKTNPFNSITKILFELPSGNFQRGLIPVKLVVYDIIGRHVAELINGELKPGVYEVEFDGSDYSSGVYFYTLLADIHRETKKMILIK